ncbi:MAG: T9SS type A sorting domain-containing protein [bacterium]|nr:T9SS type A sorting domain-containing protein [bacterium]
MSFGIIGTNIFAGSINENSNDGLVFLSTDVGTSWISINEGLPPDKWVASFATIGNNAFSGTLHSGGVWRRPLSEITSVKDELIQPTEFILEQNYPNPFNPSTVISYQLPVSSEITLNVFDVLGNEIATLVDEYKPAGRCEVEFNAASLPSGVYFYQLRAVDPSTGSGQAYVNTKNMLLLK